MSLLLVLIVVTTGHCLVSAQETQTFGCGMEFVVDPFLREEIESNLAAAADAGWSGMSDVERRVTLRNEVTSVVSRLVDFANKILAKYKFGDDNSVYKLFVRRVKILTSETCSSFSSSVDYCQTRSSLLDLILAHSSVSHDDVCLSYVLTSMEDAEGNLGKAFVPFSDNDPDSGGACDKFRTRNIASPVYHSGEGGGGGIESHLHSVRGATSLNTGAISFRHPSRGAISVETAAVVFAHEIGHSLGSPHDFPRRCLFDPSGGNYLMHPSVVRGVTNSFQELSECSVANMSRALGNIRQRQQGNCFMKDPPSVCGNGLVEQWEECDCGETDQDCQDPCCNAANVAQGCQLKGTAVCSPSEGPCCNITCSYIKPPDAIFKQQQHFSSSVHGRCSKSTECTEESFCDGKSSKCPRSRSRQDGTECAGGTKQCHQGECSQSICAKLGMQPCQILPIKPSSSSASLLSKQVEEYFFRPTCEIHCMDQLKKTCSPTSVLLKHPLYFTSSEACIYNADNDFGFCSAEDGKCHAMAETYGGGGYSWQFNAIVSAIVIAILIVLVNCFVCFYCRYCRGSFNVKGARRR